MSVLNDRVSSMLMFAALSKKVSHKLMVFFVKLSFYSTGFCVVRFE